MGIFLLFKVRVHKISGWIFEFFSSPQQNLSKW